MRVCHDTILLTSLTTSHIYCVFSFRGLLSIEMMKALEEASGQPIYSLFDFVCGVSTGSLIGIMATVFRVPLDICESVYKRFSREMFERNRLMGTSKLVINYAYYDAALWEKILRYNIIYLTRYSCMII